MNDVRRQMVKYLSGRTSLRVFQKWFGPVAWSIDETGDQDAIRLSRKVSLRLAEYTSGHWSEEEFKQRLGELI